MGNLTDRQLHAQAVTSPRRGLRRCVRDRHYNKVYAAAAVGQANTRRARRHEGVVHAARGKRASAQQRLEVPATALGERVDSTAIAKFAYSDCEPGAHVSCTRRSCSLSPA
jgi:hypothetical protein